MEMATFQLHLPSQDEGGNHHLTTKSYTLDAEVKVLFEKVKSIQGIIFNLLSNT